MSKIEVIGMAMFLLFLVVGAIAGRRCGESARAVTTCWALGCFVVAFAALVCISALAGGGSFGQSPAGDAFLLVFMTMTALPGIFGWTIGLVFSAIAPR